VISEEFRAVRDALNIDMRNRIHLDGLIAYESAVYSELTEKILRVVVCCSSAASQGIAATIATKMIERFDPAFIVLIGICAGWRGKLKIGDVVVPREIADLSMNVREDSEVHPRPQIKPPLSVVTQMFPGFELDVNQWHARCSGLFGSPIKPPPGKEQEYSEHVALQPCRSCASLILG
jgi:nucleoside phosphorylase